jgi:hypothetical protein
MRTTLLTIAGLAVVALAPGQASAWTPTALVSFSGTDGSSPDAGLISDAAGNLFGTTTRGGELFDNGVASPLS